MWQAGLHNQHPIPTVHFSLFHFKHRSQYLQCHFISLTVESSSWAQLTAAENHSTSLLCLNKTQNYILG